MLLIFCYQACKYLLIKIFTVKILTKFPLYKKLESQRRMQISEKPIMVGVLLDVSGSMREYAQVENENFNVTWDESIINILDEFLKDNVSANQKNRFFAIGFGGTPNPLINIISTLQTVEQKQNDRKANLNQYLPLTYDQVILKFYNQVYPKAKYIQKWASPQLIKKVIPNKDEAGQLLYNLEHDQQIFNQFIQLLPDRVKNGDPETMVAGGVSIGSAALLLHLLSNPFGLALVAGLLIAGNGVMHFGINGAINSNVGGYTNQQQIFKIHQQMKWIIENKYKSDLTPYEQKDYQFRKAYDIIKNASNKNNQEKLNREQIKKLLKKIQPFIYGYTPLYQAIKAARSQFEHKNQQYHKILFIISDGQPTDQGNAKQISKQLAEQNITVICCYINKNKNVDSLRIYCQQDNSWQPGAKLMFQLSSTIKTQKIPRYIFTRPNWKVDYQYNQSKLFVHANNPKNIEEICKLANTIIYSQEALSEIVSQVSLDIYINQQKENMQLTDQVGGTCYAHAASSAIHMALRRIKKRNKSDYPQLKTIRDSLIKIYKSNGADTRKVLNQCCPKYNLKCRQIDINQAKQAILQKRPVVARFRLTKKYQWPLFREFYGSNPKGILQKKDLYKKKRELNEQTSGHAVVLVSYDKRSLKFMNSYGTEWGDSGFFKIADTTVLDLQYFDVYWQESDLTQDERDYFKQLGEGKYFIKILSTIKDKNYTCPLCKYQQKLTQFTGTLDKGICPKCHKEFKIARNEQLYRQFSISLYLNSLNP